MSPRIAVVGGGITGLSACYHLEKLGFSNIVLFESSNRLGGKLQTELHGDFQIETGPDSIFTRHPEIVSFIQEIGLGDEVIEPETKGFSIYLDGALREIPPGITRLGNIDVKALDEFKHLSSEAKRKVLDERNVSPYLGSDESVGSFFRRRFGVEYATKIVEPLFAGTHGGNALELSMQGLYPDLRAQENRFGSLTCASEAGETAGVAKFISFRKGTEALSLGLASRLRSTATKFEPVDEVSMAKEQVLINREKFGAAILAIPSHRAASALSLEMPETSRLLSRISAASSIIVTLGYDQANAELNLNGTGFLVPETNDGELRGATWSSHKWGFRSNGARALVRIFLKWHNSSDQRLFDRARSELFDLVGVTAIPTFQQVNRWPLGLPQYGIGHSDLVDEIEELARNRGPLFFAGQSYRGVGIPDCVHQGKQAAEAVAVTF